MISATFKMASKAPSRDRASSFREASFRVPYEISRLNLEAPRFRLEDLGPMAPLKQRFREMRELGFPISAHFDPEREARVFLYFPNDAPRATAAFLSINTEFRPLEYRDAQGRVAYSTNKDHDRISFIAINIWICQAIHWRRHDPQVLDRIEPGLLPVIMNFREWISGSLWDTTIENFSDPAAQVAMMNSARLTSH